MVLSLSVQKAFLREKVTLWSPERDIYACCCAPMRPSLRAAVNSSAETVGALLSDYFYHGKAYLLRPKRSFSSTSPLYLYIIFPKQIVLKQTKMHELRPRKGQSKEYM